MINHLAWVFLVNWYSFFITINNEFQHCCFCKATDFMQHFQSFFNIRRKKHRSLWKEVTFFAYHWWWLIKQKKFSAHMKSCNAFNCLSLSLSLSLSLMFMCCLFHFQCWGIVFIPWWVKVEQKERPLLIGAYLIVYSFYYGPIWHRNLT